MPKPMPIGYPPTRAAGATCAESLPAQHPSAATTTAAIKILIRIHFLLGMELATGQNRLISRAVFDFQSMDWGPDNDPNWTTITPSPNPLGTVTPPKSISCCESESQARSIFEWRHRGMKNVVILSEAEGPASVLLRITTKTGAPSLTQPHRGKGGTNKSPNQRSVASPQQPLSHRHIQLHRFKQLPLGQLLIRSMRHMNRPRPQQQRLAPVAQLRNIRRELRHHRRQSFHRLEPHKRNLQS